MNMMFSTSFTFHPRAGQPSDFLGWFKHIKNLMGFACIWMDNVKPIGKREARG